MLLAGLVQFQLKRADALFRRGHSDAALRTVEGALLLVQEGGPFDTAIAGQGSPLLFAAHHAARRGDSGRAEALYELSLRAGASTEAKTAISAHLAAIRNFEKQTQRPIKLLTNGNEARRLLARSYLVSDRATFEGATASIVSWMESALEAQMAMEGKDSEPDRDEALEAYRAIRGGAPAIIALSIRQSAPLDALKTIDAASLNRALPPGMRLRLEAAGEANSPEAWMDLYRLFDAAEKAPDPEAGLEPEIAFGAAFWSALELYRSSPGKLEHAMPLVLCLGTLGMPEVSAAILSENLRLDTPLDTMAWSLSVVLRGMFELSMTDQDGGVRRVYEDTEHLRELLKEPRFAHLRPGPEKLTTLLANVEIRRGRLEAALTLLRQVAKLNPTTEALLRLSDLESQAGHFDQAIVALHDAIPIAQNDGDVLSEALVYEKLFQLHRDRGELSLAEAHLRTALERCLSARSIDLRPGARPGIERLLARILEHYGERGRTLKAFERALDESRMGEEELSVTLTDMARSALTTGDVKLARLAARRAAALEFRSDQVVYIALWLRLTEEQAKVPPDGTATALLQSASATGWAEHVRNFGLGRLDGPSLLKAANTFTERTEADFYLSWSRGRVDLERLKTVAEGTAIDLLEVRIARDLLAKQRTFTLPKDVALPKDVTLP